MKMTMECNCPVCGAKTRRYAQHPEAELLRCDICTHVFSEQLGTAGSDIYDPTYFQDTHKNWFANPNIALFDWILENVPNSATSLVDVGCGNGGFLRYVKSRRPDLELWGIDLTANEEVDGIRFVQTDAVEAKIDRKFDVIVTQAVIEHIPDVRSFCNQLVKLSHEGSLVFVMTLNNDSILYVAARLAKRLGIEAPFNRLYSAHHVHHFTPRSLSKALERFGFEISHVHHHNVPLKAIDLPRSGYVLRVMFIAGVAIVFAIGKLFRRCYLQTVVARVGRAGGSGRNES